MIGHVPTKIKFLADGAKVRTVYKKLQGQKCRIEGIDYYYFAMLLARLLVLRILLSAVIVHLLVDRALLGDGERG